MSALSSSREIAAPPSAVYAAFTDPARLARWWGPAGFSNEFEYCDFKPAGKWKYVMIGPDGRRYKNESVFEEASPSRIVVRHVSEPRYRLTIGLAASGIGTRVSWDQVFDDPRVAEKLQYILVPANAQNLDRLTAEVTENSK